MKMIHMLPESKRVVLAIFGIQLNCNVKNVLSDVRWMKEDSDQPAHLHSMIENFTECILDSKDARVDLSLSWAQMSKTMFGTLLFNYLSWKDLKPNHIHKESPV